MDAADYKAEAASFFLFSTVFSAAFELELEPEPESEPESELVLGHVLAVPP